jgi:hypothetical protein
VLGGGRIEGAGGQPGLAHGKQLGRVQLEQAVHPRHRDDDPAVQRHRCRAQVGPCAPRGDRHPVGGGDAQDLAHLGGVGRLHHDVGPGGDERRGVAGVSQEGAVLGDGALAQQVGELPDVRRSAGSEGAHEHIILDALRGSEHR